jgi:hypothetical protein
MSKISLQPNDSGTGTFTLESPNSNTNRTLTLPDEAGTVATVENLPAGYTDSDALSLFNATGSAPVYACRAWVNFDGTGTVAIRASGNVSSITDNGTGDYTVSFATAMPDNNYAISGFGRLDLSTTSNVINRVPDIGVRRASTPSTSSVRIQCNEGGDRIAFDCDFITTCVTR